ncbi:type VI secretion system protein TssA [Phyllobacterium leguminum]|uniref:Type VI secretion system protein VasJ n=1 Tax=Phyllobacterium leguminum TaxID=314237 RepID=A0A318TAE6_9HYPH|nr:type VI secretion system protein TssA [Phyllobacterium leguminum]PYE85288.1 type VI secretion system protein VasJ [Phyllobacterium leguminum]
MMAGDENRPADYLTGLGWVDTHPWMIAVGADVPGAQPQGMQPDDWEEFQDIETEMMKRGTLAHGQIRWNWLAEQCELLTRERTKDLRLLAILLQCLPHSTVPARAPLAAALVARFMTLWGKSAFPAGRVRAREIGRIGDLLEGFISKAIAQDEHLEPNEIAATASAIECCSAIFAETAPDLGIRFAILPARLEAAAKEEAPPPKSQPAVAKHPDSSSSATATALRAPETPAPRPESLRLDTGNERALKQSLTVVADFLLGQDAGHPLSYRLRRYATWYGITSLPPIKSGSRTVLQPVSEDVAEGYRIAAERGQAGADIVQKLERSCHLQPFWLEGQMLAYRLARACGRVEAAEAIRSETQRFASSLPGLEPLCFTDGSPILTPDARQWLGNRADTDRRAGFHPDSGNGASDSAAMVGGDLQSVVRTAREKGKEGDFAAAMQLLDGARGSESSPRERAIWELVILECLSDWGMKSHAASQAARLKEAIAGKTVEEWEPELLKRIGRINHGTQ